MHEGSISTQADVGCGSFKGWSSPADSDAAVRTRGGRQEAESQPDIRGGGWKQSLCHDHTTQREGTPQCMFGLVGPY